MVKTKSDYPGERYIEGEVTIYYKAYLFPEDEREEISEDEALALLQEKLYSYVDSNDGSELLANAVPKISYFY